MSSLHVIDSLVSCLDDLSSTELYALIVTLTVLISFLLLGQAPSEIPSSATTTTTTSTHSSRSKEAATSSSTLPEPKWHLFRYTNYIIGGCFLVSILELAMYGMPTHNMVWHLLVWSVCLCYFFGFFGISFVYGMEQHDDIRYAKHITDDRVCCACVPLQGPVILPSRFLTYGVFLLACLSSSETTTAAANNHNIKTLSHPNDASNNVQCRTNTSERNTGLCHHELPLKTKSPSPLAAAAAYPVVVDVKHLSDQEICDMVLNGTLKDHELETQTEDALRAVAIRRKVVHAKLGTNSNNNNNQEEILQGLPYEHALDYASVLGTNCEIVVGYVPLPVGLVGPLTINNEQVYVPMATTEGCLVASTNRGAKALSMNGGSSGVTAVVLRDGITRAPCLRLPSAQQAAQVHQWCSDPTNFSKLRTAFESTTSFGKLLSVAPTVAGRNVYLRLVCFSGDAMGMNMVSKGSLAVVECLAKYFPDLKLLALSGNMCTDKKAAATNWLEGRGKSVVVEATVSAAVVRSVLKTTVKALVEVNINKNLIGSAMAGTIGGFNAHASNIVTAIFLAAGQDPAQNVESSNCITLMEETEEGDLWISCTMPSLEVGTVGGGTSLAAQSACLDVMRCKGGGEKPGQNAQRLAMIVAATTMAGELSLLAALAANTLVQAHMQHNRKKN